MGPAPIHAFDDDLAALDAVATAAAVRRGDLSAVEAVEAAIRRAERVADRLGAVATPDHDRARHVAAAGPTGPLAGVPSYVKDNAAVAGIPLRNGSAALAGARPARRTSAIARQLAALGAVALGTSALPEFGLTATTEHCHDAPTRNPWDPGRTAGGSSGGSAALVAAGVVPIAHGNDGGGSIRIPAACCGLVGLKVSRGRLHDSPESRLAPVRLAVEGVLTRTVRDTARYLAAAELRRRGLPPVGHVTAPPTRSLRVGVVSEVPIDVEVDGPTRRVLDATVDLLADLGHDPVPVEAPLPPRFEEDFEHYWAMLAQLVIRSGRLLDPSFDPTRLTPFTTGLAERFGRRSGATPGAVRRLRSSAAFVERSLAALDVVLSPTLTSLPPRLGHLSPDGPFDEVLGRVRDWVAFTPLANATGLPAISLPLGFDAPSGLPVGMMFTGRYGQEALLLSLALQLEEARPWGRPGDPAP
jgi:amidase